MSALAKRATSGLAIWGLALAAGGALGVAALIAGGAPQTAPAPHALHMAQTQQGPSIAGRPGVLVTPVSCEKLPHVPGKSITTARVEFPPNAYSPRHRHGGSVTVYVLEGTIRSQLEGGPVGTFRAGESFFEPPGVIHAFAENPSQTESAAVLATFVADDCAVLTTYLD